MTTGSSGFSIAVIERAQHHVFWSRVPDYGLTLLHALLVLERQVVEGWSHAAPFLPIRDYRYYLPYKQAMSRGGSGRHRSCRPPWPTCWPGSLAWESPRFTPCPVNWMRCQRLSRAGKRPSGCCRL
ncbi:MAG: winged helix DNA-binding domain-containing protein [Candidatus Sericytochromatia bacterium]|nr:winged helix DNA-binding domain-containing protein [Candidatus Sericytochromatia bacterium]